MWTAVPEDDTPGGVTCIRTLAERLLFPANFIDPVCDWRHFGSRRLLDAIQPDDFDVVHLHNIHGNWISIKALHRLCNRVPVVWTPHDEWAATNGIQYDLSRLSELKRQLEMLQRKLPRSVPLSPDHPTAKARNQFLSQWMPIPRTIISPSKYIADLVAKNPKFAETPIQRIPYGLRFAENPACIVDRETAREKWGLPSQGHVVLIVSAHLDSPYKGTWFAVEALNRIVKEHPAFPLSVLTLGRASETLSSQFDSSINVRCGYASTDVELCHAYRGSDVTLIPSTADNFPYVALESFACETPIMSFAVGGLPELVGNSERGISISPFDIREMSDSLVSLLKNEEQRVPLGKAAIEWVRTECNFENYIDRIVSEYQKWQQQ